MRLPIAPALSTKDGISSKNARMTNALKETDGSSELACLRPCLVEVARTVGNGRGLVAFNDRLLSIYGSTIGYKVPMVNASVASLNPDNSLQGDARAVSADGTVVVGYYDGQLFRWDDSTGLSLLGGAASWEALFTTNAVTAGTLDSHAFCWTSSTGIVDLGTLGGATSIATALSSDGTTIVGVSDASGQGGAHAFRWTAASGMIDLGTLGGGSQSRATGVSADGSVVIGYSYLEDSYTIRAFCWTALAGMVDLGTLGGYYTTALSVSADGNVVVGLSYIDQSTGHAFRWTAATGLVDIHTLGSHSSAIAVSADGTTIVGEYS
jgi:probable HAF family extracellular repeat protein